MVELAVDRSGLVVVAPVVAELAMGTRTDRQEQELHAFLALFPSLRFRGAADLDAGAAVYRRCRRAGVTPGGLVDCVIVAIAAHHDASLLTADVGQARAARVMGVALDPASVSP
jgi:predicted nucleic acid-binding protein